MQLLYHDEAEANRTYVISSCGMDSVPADLGVIHFMNNFEGIYGLFKVNQFLCLNVLSELGCFYFYAGQVNYVESYLKVNSNAEGHVGTFPLLWIMV